MSELGELRQGLRKFTDEREWGSFHDPKSVLLALVGEVGELAELLQWLPAERVTELARDEALHHQPRRGDCPTCCSTWCCSPTSSTSISPRSAGEARRRAPALPGWERRRTGRIGRGSAGQRPSATVPWRSRTPVTKPNRSPGACRSCTTCRPGTSRRPTPCSRARLEPVRQRPDRLAQRRVSGSSRSSCGPAGCRSRPRTARRCRWTRCPGSRAGCPRTPRSYRRRTGSTPAQPVRRGLRDHDERAVRGQRDPVGELQPVASTWLRRRGRGAAAARCRSARADRLSTGRPRTAGRVAEVDGAVRRTAALLQNPTGAVHLGHQWSPRRPSRSSGSSPRRASQTSSPPSGSHSSPSGRPPVSASTSTVPAVRRQPQDPPVRRPRSAPCPRRRRACPRARARARRARSAAAPPGCCGAAAPGPARPGGCQTTGEIAGRAMRASCPSPPGQALPGRDLVKSLLPPVSERLHRVATVSAVRRGSRPVLGRCSWRSVMPRWSHGLFAVNPGRPPGRRPSGAVASGARSGCSTSPRSGSARSSAPASSSSSARRSATPARRSSCRSSSPA